MQTTVRTTIRIKKELLDQSRLLALKRGTSLQEIINDTLALGFGKISDIDSTKEAMRKINEFRLSMVKKELRAEKLLEMNKSDLK